MSVLSLSAFVSIRRYVHISMSLLLLSACAAAPPTSYDLVQDRSVSRFYQSIADFFITYPVGDVGACEYEQFVDFYHDGLLSSYALRVRARAMPGNQASRAQYELLVASIERLQAMHQEACLNGFQVQDLQASFDALFGAILHLELEKRYGE